jgi:peptidoglycan/xylan/chitin deacetylase (PgdA/CDA1 family)
VLKRHSGAIAFLRSAGHEAGWHGHKHDHRDHVRPHADRAVEALLASPLIDKTGPPLGMRLPKLLKSNALFQLLGEKCPALRYDTSFLYGIAPFNLSVNGRSSNILEIPTTVPTDIRVHNEVLTLPRLRRAAAILKAQIARTEQLIAAGAIISIVTHPEKGLSEQPELLEVYDQYLDYVRSRNDVWFATSGELFSHWTNGGGATAQKQSQ